MLNVLLPPTNTTVSMTHKLSEVGIGHLAISCPCVIGFGHKQVDVINDRRQSQCVRVYWTELCNVHQRQHSATCQGSIRRKCVVSVILVRPRPTLLLDTTDWQRGICRNLTLFRCGLNLTSFFLLLSLLALFMLQWRSWFSSSSSSSGSSSSNCVPSIYWLWSASSIW